jgi:hypothetical protein
MTAYSTQGSKVESAKQTAYGSASGATYDDWRLEGAPSFKIPVGEPTVPETVFINPNDVEKPIIIKKPMEDAVKLTTLIRQAAVAGENSMIKDAFLSGGYDINTGVNTTVNDAAATVAAIDLTAVTNLDAGWAINMYITSKGLWYPTLINNIATNTVTPQMELIAAPADTAPVNAMDCIIPGDTGQITVTDLLTIRAFLKAQDGGNDVVWEAIDCGVSSVDDITLNPGEPVSIGFNFGASDVSESTGTMGNNDFRDSTFHVPFNNPICQFATASSSGAITAAYHNLMSATISLGVTSEPITGFGSASTISNNTQGRMQKNAPAKLTVTMLYDEQKLDEFVTETTVGTDNPDRYVGIIQPGASEDDPAFAFWMPKAHMTLVSSEPWTENEHRVTLEFTPKPAGMDSDTGNQDGNQPWYLAIAADSTDA